MRIRSRLLEAVATFGLVLVLRGSASFGAAGVAAGVPTYIFAAYWFTSSTSFAKPAVTPARSVSDTFAGIRPESLDRLRIEERVRSIGLPLP